jgi:hypothetical protein
MSEPGTDTGGLRLPVRPDNWSPFDTSVQFDPYDGLTVEEYWILEMKDSVGMEEGRRMGPLRSRVQYPHVVQWLWLLVQRECNVKDEAGEDYMFFKSMIQVHI